MGTATEATPRAGRSDYPQKAQTGAQKRGGEVVRGSNHSSSEVDRGLVALALSDGSARRAERLLREQGEPIAQTTLRRWKDDTYSGRYLDVKRSVLPRLNALQAEQYDAMATRANSLNVKLLDRLEDTYEELPPRDLPGAARNLATVAGIATDKATILRAQDTGLAAAGTRSIKDILSALEGKGVKLTVELGPDPQPDAIEGTAAEQG